MVIANTGFWVKGDVVAEEDVKLVVVDLDDESGLCLVTVHLWNEDSESYERIGEKINAVAQVSDDDLGWFLRGTTPTSVVHLLEMADDEPVY